MLSEEIKSKLRDHKSKISPNDLEQIQTHLGGLNGSDLENELTSLIEYIDGVHLTEPLRSVLLKYKDVLVEIRIRADSGAKWRIDV